MKVPEFLFAIINPVMKFLLRSPLHVIWSGSLMLITFTGRNSGRTFTTPVRYTRHGDLIRCYTAADGQWWRNLRGGADVMLRIRGEDHPFYATATSDNPDLIRERLVEYLAQYPQDAIYHDIRLNRDKTLVEEDLERAIHHAVVVEAVPR